jgi:penicillin-binding protein 1A
VVASITILSLCTAAVVAAATMVGDSVHLGNTLGPLRALSQRTTVYAADGTTQIGLLGLEDRQDVPLSQVPKLLVDAVVDTEDATFFTNPGIDVAAMARSTVSNLDSGKVLRGGSTITQQLAKNRLLSPKRDLERKLKEISLALQLTERYSKKRILQEYLNTVYFGQGAYGVAVAAERFFSVVDPVTGDVRGKRLDELDLPEMALLAGVISSPERDSPFKSPERARARRSVVLQRMVDRHSITPVEAYLAGAAPLPTAAPPIDLRPRSYFVDEVQRQLFDDQRLGPTAAGRRKLVLSGGLKVYTTLDLAAQARAEQAVAEILPDQPPFTAALVAMDPATGAVRAMVGGPNFQSLQYNLVTHEPGRQPGSTYKAITLAAALDAGYSPNDMLDGSSPCRAVHPPLPPWDTQNAEPGGGVLSLRDATAGSVNCAFAHLIASLGPQAVVDMAHRLGVTQPVPPYLSITLGTNETTPLEMATVASTLAAGGIRHNPTFVSKVVGPDGRVVFDDSQANGLRVLNQDIADCEADLLQGVVGRGTGTAAALPGRPVAGKTGTTDLKTDAWFLGYTPQLATVVWMGATDGAVPMSNVGGITVFGGTYPARIWHEFMSAQLDGAPVLPFAPPGPVCDRPGVFVTDGPRNEAPPVPPPGAVGPRRRSAPAADGPAPTAGPAPSPAPAPAPGPVAPTPPTPPNGPGNGKGHGRP